MNWTPLHRLCVSLNEDDPSYASSLQQFVDQLNVPTCTGTTPLHFAVIGDSFKLVVYLIVNKAKVNQKNNVGETPLHWAVQKDNERVVTFLLDNGADFTLCDNDGNMPIHWAAQEGNLRAVQQLLEVRSPFDKPNHEDITPLMYAISSGNAEVVKLLLQAGASVDSRVIRHAVDMEEPTILVLLTGGKPKNLIPVRPSATNSNRLESAPEISKRTLLSKIKGFTRKKKEHLQIHTQSLQRQVSL